MNRFYPATRNKKKGPNLFRFGLWSSLSRASADLLYRHESRDGGPLLTAVATFEKSFEFVL